MFKLTDIRWALDFSKWRPSKVEWIQSLGRVDRNEQERISRFMFKRDAKASLVGQLMIRKLVWEVTKSPVELGRTDRGRPTLLNFTGFPFQFNVSHQGSFTVMAASVCERIGVDIMRIDADRFDDEKLEKFFHTMRNQFTINEWAFIKQGDLVNQLTNFYRFWCLKESYVKAIGIGITVDLQTIEFHISESLSCTNVVSSTQLKVNGTRMNNWMFQEHFLDPYHCVCVAIYPEPTKNRHHFELVNIEDLLSGTNQVADVPDEMGREFELKEEEPQYPWK